MTAEAERLAGRRVVITGGLGFVGGRLARALAGGSGDLTVVDALVPTHGGNVHNIAGVDDVRVVRADLRDTDRWAGTLRDADVVFNLAGQRSHTDSMRDPRGDLEHNCDAQLAFLEACREHAASAVVVFASTRQVYGRVARVPVDESAAVEPVDINGIHKAAAERYHRLYHRVHGLRAVSLRLTNTYGPGMRIRDARQGFLGAWVGAAVRGEEFEVWGGEQRRDFNHVDDVVRALVLAATEPALAGGVYNLGGSEVVTLRELADLLVAVAGGSSYRVVPLPEEAQRIDIGDYAGDFSAFRSATGWRPQVALEEGLAETVAFYREQVEHYR